MQQSVHNMMIDIAEKELNIPIRKKSVPEASKNLKKREFGIYLFK